MFAVHATSLGHTYRKASRPALQDLNLAISPGEIFGLLGPNGGGKTTLFRILSTLLVPSQGECSVFDWDIRKDQQRMRQAIGVVFQSPSLDKKLSVRENFLQQGHLYGLHGQALAQEIAVLLRRFGLEEKSGELTEKLSGGLRRRVELAKGMLHQPKLLILDEPSTGLDPGIRREFWNFLLALRKDTGITILLTTHLLDEAERCDRLAILDQGKLVALGTPDGLKASVGGDVISLKSKNPEELSKKIWERFSLPATSWEDTVRIELPRGHEFVARLAEAFASEIDSISVGKPTLEDVFIDKTGHRLWNDGAES